MEIKTRTQLENDSPGNKRTLRSGSETVIFLANKKQRAMLNFSE